MCEVSCNNDDRGELDVAEVMTMITLQRVMTLIPDNLTRTQHSTLNGLLGP